MSADGNPTLESTKQLKDVYNLYGYTLGAIIRAMQKTGFQTWGFVIYRGTYSDDATWERYLAFMKNQIQAELEEHGLAELLLQYLRYTIIEDRALEGASKNDIRKIFREWISHRSVERDGIGADHPGFMLYHNCIIPRFSHCIFVDEGCLNTLPRYEAWQNQGSKGLDPLVACALIDVECDAAGMGPKGCSEIEGCTRRYVGWMYLSLDCIPSIYNSQSIKESRGYQEYDSSYIRPPLIYPSTGGMEDGGDMVHII